MIGPGITRATAAVGLGLGKAIGIRTVGVVEGRVEGLVGGIVYRDRSRSADRTSRWGKPRPPSVPRASVNIQSV